MTPRLWIRAGLIYIASYQVIVGVWQYAFPHSFFYDIPTVSLDPPYNEHLMSDVGGLGLSIAAVILIALYFMEFRLICAAIAGNFVYAFTHFLYHATHFSGWDVGSTVTVATVLGMNVLIPIAMYVAARRIRDDLT